MSASLQAHPDLVGKFRVAGKETAPRSVTSLRLAYDAYWTARTAREEQAAYHEILLFGGKDGYGNGGRRESVVRWLRQLALWIEG